MELTEIPDQKSDTMKGIIVQGFDAIKLDQVQIDPSLELSSDVLNACKTGDDFSKLLENLPGEFIVNNLKQAIVVKQMGSVYGLGFKYGTQVSILMERGPCPIPTNFEIDYCYYDSSGLMGTYFWALVDLNTKNQYKLTHVTDSHTVPNSSSGDSIYRLNVKILTIKSGSNLVRSVISKADVIKAYKLEDHENYSLVMCSAQTAWGYSASAAPLQRLKIDFD